jgi:hypothetical protein
MDADKKALIEAAMQRAAAQKAAQPIMLMATLAGQRTRKLMTSTTMRLSPAWRNVRA